MQTDLQARGKGNVSPEHWGDTKELYAAEGPLRLEKRMLPLGNEPKNGQRSDVLREAKALRGLTTSNPEDASESSSQLQPTTWIEVVLAAGPVVILGEKEGSSCIARYRPYCLVLVTKRMFCFTSCRRLQWV